MRSHFHIVFARLAAYRRACHGAAAVEFAILLPVLTLPLLNVVDLGLYAYQRMQVGNAALAGAEQARSFCNATAKLPATDSVACPGFSAALTSAIQSTSIGSNVALMAGYPIEAYYCTLTTGALQQVGTPGTFGGPPTPPVPDTCDAVANHSAANGTAPGDYIQVQVTYAFSPVFTGISVAALLPTPIIQTSWSRLN